ncbi:hypothetical protein ASF57_16160 [Methylobacterium sp. Leaf117]|nr:hypothetical protein ASF57_16160 [Methylobacterium sp. Leaf117]
MSGAGFHLAPVDRSADIGIAAKILRLVEAAVSPAVTPSTLPVIPVAITVSVVPASISVVAAAIAVFVSTIGLGEDRADRAEDGQSQNRCCTE